MNPYGEVFEKSKWGYNNYHCYWFFYFIIFFFLKEVGFIYLFFLRRLRSGILDGVSIEWYLLYTLCFTHLKIRLKSWLQVIISTLKSVCKLIYNKMCAVIFIVYLFFVRSQIILSTILAIQNSNYTQEHKYLCEKPFLFEGKKITGQTPNNFIIIKSIIIILMYVSWLKKNLSYFSLLSHTHSKYFFQR